MSSQQQQQQQPGPSRAVPSAGTKESTPAATHRELDRCCTDIQAWPLHHAGHSNNLGEIRNLLQQQPLPPSRNRPRLLQGSKSIDIHARDPYGFTALHYAVRAQDRRIAKYLLEFPGSCLTEIQDNIGQSALHWAAQLCLVDIVRLLCDANACVTAEDMLGWTPLHHLCSSNFARDPNHQGPVMSIIRRLIRSAREDKIWESRDKRGRMPIHIAATYGVSTPIIKELLSLDKQCVNAKDHEQWTPLHYAEFHRQLEIVRELQEWDIGAVTSEGWSTLELHEMAEQAQFGELPDYTQQTWRDGSDQSIMKSDKTTTTPQSYHDRLCSIIKQKHILPLFPAKRELLMNTLRPYVTTYSNISNRFREAVAPGENAMRTVPNELLLDLGVLTLYDHTVIVDDSASMTSKLTSGSPRRLLVQRILGNIYSINAVIGRGLKEIHLASTFAGQPPTDRSQGRSSGESRIGSCLWKAIVKPLQKQRLVRPLVITIITDGEVDPMEAHLLERAMLQGSRNMQILRAPGALLFQFVNVGKSSAESKGGDGYGVLRALTRQSELVRYVDIVDWQRDCWDINDIRNMGKSSSSQYSSPETPALRNMARMVLGPMMRAYREPIHSSLEKHSTHQNDKKMSRSSSTGQRE